MPNPYLNLVHANLPRILALFDMDSNSHSYGIGDRYRWAWALIDFGNATFQGMAHGLARLVANRQLPAGISEASVLRRIDAMFQGTKKLQRSNGSVEEAFPYEASFCVTSLVAYDLLSAIELLDGALEVKQKNAYLDVVRPMIRYILNNDETHAFISNHLATAAAALVKWQIATGENVEVRAVEIIGLILENQSNEGWFKEYEGADPGYQSLCTYYLADVHRLRPDLGLIEPLKKSILFLWHFAHPDGSFGGLYGSRNTRFCYPAGLEYLAEEIPEAASLAIYIRNSVAQQTVVTLSAMDEPNLAPMFNAYCWASEFNREYPHAPTIPCGLKTPLRSYWPGAGLLLERGLNYYTIVSAHKGGVVYHFKDGKLSVLDPGILARTANNELYSTQSYERDNKVTVSEKTMEVQSGLRPLTRRLPTPFQFWVLRTLNITLMRYAWFREKIKYLLVRFLITGKNRSAGHNKRVITLGYELKVEDAIFDNQALTKVDNVDSFSSIHMASQGYWQLQDDS